MTRTLRLILLVPVALALLFVGFVAWRHLAPVPMPPSTTPLADATTVQRGAYLARAGNCLACHTQAGQPAYSGGRRIDTPFGAVFAPNLTPDADTGLGRWSADDFWRAVHEGRSRDGRLLYPAFPYPQTTRMPREDVDALYAYLRSLPPVRQATPAPALRFPYDTQAALMVWRALYFTPGVQQPVPGRSARWNRGAYLVEGPAHCLACHASRNGLGAIDTNSLAGGALVPEQHWYAPSLHRADEAGVADWTEADIVALLRTGQSPRGRVQGPMAEVVFHGTQHLTEADLGAMAEYLRSLPQDTRPAAPAEAPPAAIKALGEKLYGQHCADCHGAQGQGSAGGAYPALAGNRMVTLAQPDNLIRMVLEGGFGPSTAGRPRPYGMPPFEQSLSNDEVAAVLTYLRSSWGHHAAEVTALDVLRRR